MSARAVSGVTRSSLGKVVDEEQDTEGGRNDYSVSISPQYSKYTASCPLAQRCGLAVVMEYQARQAIETVIPMTGVWREGLPVVSDLA